MRTNIDINDDLMAAAMAAGGFKTKREAVEEGLRLVSRRKVYDGLLDDMVTLKSTGLILGDTVELSSSTALFLTNTVGTAKKVNVSGIALKGTAAANYTANTTATTSASITK